MDGKERDLWLEALEDQGDAYRRLGEMYLRKGVAKSSEKDRRLARLCLEKSSELGDEPGYLLYHRIFSRGKKVIDDRSYEAMQKEYQMTEDGEEKKRLARYLELGTKEQKRELGK